MAISFSTVAGTGYRTAVASNAGGGLSLTVPTDWDVDGNFLLCGLAARNAFLATEDLTMSDASGSATQLAWSGDTQNPRGRMAYAWQDNTPSDGTMLLSYASATTATQKTGIIMAMSGVDISTPVVDAVAAEGSGTTITFPDADSASAGDLIFRVAFWEGTGNNTPNISSLSNQFVATLPTSDFTTGVAAAVSTSSGGTPGTATATLSVTSGWLAFTVIVKAAAAGGASPKDRSGGFFDLSGNMRG
jgi:hypothetical protein